MPPRVDPRVRAGVKLLLMKKVSYRRISLAYGVSLGLVAQCAKELKSRPVNGRCPRHRPGRPRLPHALILLPFLKKMWDGWTYNLERLRP